MKNYYVLILIMLLSSCSKVELVYLQPQEEASSSGKKAKLPDDPYLGRKIVYQNSSGDYVCHYGNGFNFGRTFVHPTNAAYYGSDGTTYSGYNPAWGVSDLDLGANLYEFEMTSSYRFVAYYRKLSGFDSPISREAFNRYKQAVKDYYSNAKKADGTYKQATMPRFSNFAPSTVPGDGYYTITGMFVIDSASPTNVSISDKPFSRSESTGGGGGLPPLLPPGSE